MILNFYIDTDSDDSVKASERVETILADEGYRIFDATEFDPYTSGFCKVENLAIIMNDFKAMKRGGIIGRGTNENPTG